MNVIFMNTFYYPSVEERRRLELIQDKLHFALVELAFHGRNLSQYQQSLMKERYHQGFRSRLKLINNEL